MNIDIVSVSNGQCCEMSWAYIFCPKENSLYEIWNSVNQQKIASEIQSILLGNTSETLSPGLKSVFRRFNRGDWWTFSTDTLAD